MDGRMNGEHYSVHFCGTSGRLSTEFLRLKRTESAGGGNWARSRLCSFFAADMFYSSAGVRGKHNRFVIVKLVFYDKATNHGHILYGT